MTTQVIDTISFDIPQILTQVESAAIQGWKGLKLKMQLGLDSVGKFYSELVINSCTTAAASATSPLSSTKIKRRDPIVLPALEELGIGLVPFSPLGKGLLTGSKRIQGYGSSCAQCRSNAD